jgi:hypothetical protein
MKEKCPTCGTLCEVKWHGLDLVAESGDETLASKSYKPYELPTEEEIKERFYKELTYTQRITKGDEVSIMPTRFKRGPEQVLDWVLNLLKG